MDPRGARVRQAYLAITSTYRPLFRAFFAPAFLGAAAPIKSSMLLALPRLVAGLLGGALGGPPALLMLLALLIIGGPPRAFRPSECDGGRDRLLALRDIGGPGGGTPRPPGGALVGPRPSGGGGVPFPFRDAALGGGGVAVFAGISSPPPFLFTQRFKSGS